ncbi:MAG: hypothetical protein H9Q66_02975 [Spiroplasma ixodetis]|nr:hypothetical protein [Spiroplasma ixodetis]
MMGAVIKATIKQNKQEKVELEDENNEKSSILQRKLEELQLETVGAKILKKQLERTKVEFELVKAREELAKLNNITSLNITSSPIPQEFNLAKVVNVETSNSCSLSIHKKISTYIYKNVNKQLKRIKDMKTELQNLNDCNNETVVIVKKLYIKKIKNFIEKLVFKLL